MRSANVEVLESLRYKEDRRSRWVVQACTSSGKAGNGMYVDRKYDRELGYIAV